MTKDPILEELHETRRKLLENAGGTLEGLVAGLEKRQRDSARRVIESRRNTRNDEVRPLVT